MPLDVLFPDSNRRFRRPFLAFGHTTNTNPVTITLSSMDVPTLKIEQVAFLFDSKTKWLAKLDIAATPTIVGHRCQLEVAQAGATAPSPIENIRVRIPRGALAQAKDKSATKAGLTGSLAITAPPEGVTIASHANCCVSGTVTGGTVTKATLVYIDGGASFNGTVHKASNPWVAQFSTAKTGREPVSVTVVDSNGNADHVEFILVELTDDPEN